MATKLNTTLPGPDMRVEFHGSVCLLRPLTDTARTWIDENNIAPEGWQWMGGAVACEPRYVQDVIDGARRDGVKVAG